MFASSEWMGHGINETKLQVVKLKNKKGQSSTSWSFFFSIFFKVIDTISFSIFFLMIPLTTFDRPKLTEQQKLSI